MFQLKYKKDSAVELNILPKRFSTERPELF